MSIHLLSWKWEVTQNKTHTPWMSCGHFWCKLLMKIWLDGAVWEQLGLHIYVVFAFQTLIDPHCWGGGKNKREMYWSRNKRSSNINETKAWRLEADGEVRCCNVKEGLCLWAYGVSIHRGAGYSEKKEQRDEPSPSPAVLYRSLSLAFSPMNLTSA